MNASQPIYGDIVVGARGWRHPAWQQDYYPEDIPEEWRLGFYGNEFNTLILPWADWCEGIESEWCEQLDDLDDNFHLYLELPSEVQALPEGIASLGEGEQLAGLVCRQGDAEQWREQADITGLALLKQVSPVDGPFQCYACSGEDTVRLVLVDTAAQQIEDLLGMREVVEQVLPVIENIERLDFILVDNEPAIESMRNTQTIAELLGA